MGIVQVTGESWNICKSCVKTVPPYLWYVLGWSVIVGLGIPLAGQICAPFHILTHEFTQLYTILTGIVLYYLARWVVRKVALVGTDISPIARMRKAIFPVLAGIGVMGVATLAVMYIANALYWHCQFYRGVPFFWVTWLPVAVWASVGGILVGMSGWGWWKSIAVPVAVLALSVIQDVLQALNGARMVDFVIGEPLAIDQRHGMAISEIHFYQRMFVMLLAYSLWQLGLWHFGRSWAAGGPEYPEELRHMRSKSCFISAILVIAAISLGSHIGLGWGRAAFNNELSEVYRTDHFIFRFAPGGNTEDNIEIVATGAEWYWHRLSTHWNVAPEKPVEVYVFDGNSMYRLTGSSSAHAMINKIFITYYSALSQVLYHELVHALHQDGFSPKLTMWLNRGIVEGLAQAYEDELVWLPEAHRDCAGALKAGKLPSATDFMSPFGFWKVQETLAYNSAASFIGFLIYRYGMAAFRQFQQSLDYHRAYGKELPELATEWTQFLENVSVDIDTQIRVGDYFDAAYWGAYSQEYCPKLGEQRPDQEYRARRLWIGGYYDKALELYRNLFETTGEVRWGYQAALCLQRLERFDQAIAILDDLSSGTDLTDFERAKILKATTSILMGQRDWPALYAAFDELAAFEGGERSEDQRIIESLLHRPGVRESVAEALMANDSYRRRRLLEELAEVYPDDLEIQYMYATRAFGTVYIRPGGVVITPAQESQIVGLLEFIEKVPEAVDKSIDVLLNYGVASIHARNYELAGYIGDTVLRHSSDPLNRFKAERILERVDFERGHTISH